MNSLLQDLQYAIRMLVKNPGFTLIAVLALALGIGANTGIFSIVNSVLLRPLPYRDPDRIISVWQKLQAEDHANFSPSEFLDWAPQSQVFESLGVSTGNGYTLTGRGEPTVLLGQMASPGVFQTLGVPAALGRIFLAEEAQAGRDHVVVFSNGLWREKFGGDSKIIGKSVILNSEAYTVVGVMPAGFDYPAATYRLWVPAALSTGIFQKFKDAHLLRVIGRLKPGISEARLKTELDAVSHRIAERDPKWNRRLMHAPLQQATTGEIRRPLLVIMIAVGFVLLIACANVANLLLARATTRQREMAVRAAMGAGRLRLMRQLLVESVVISIAGGLFGFLLATWGIDALIAFSPANLPGIQNTHIDEWVLGFTVLVSIGTGLLFGLAPALTSWNSDWNEVLKQGSRGAAGGPGSRLRGALVAAEIALSIVLLTSSGLMLRSFLRLQSVNPGFRAENVLTASLALSETRYPEAAGMIAFDRALLAKLRSLPGVEAVATNTHLPFSGQGWGNAINVEGHPARPGEGRVAQVQCISTRYFTSMGIPLMRGREFDERDTEKALPVAIVSESMAKAYWPDEDPIGKRLELDGPWRTVVGITGDVKRMGLDANEQPQLYIPYVQLAPAFLKFLGRGIFIALRTSIDPSSVAGAVRMQVHELDPEMALVNTTMQQMIYKSVAQPRFRTWLIGIFSVLALLLACIGIYGVMSYTVTQRSREMGLRMALGAARANVMRLVLGNALTMTLSGIGVGLILSFGITRLLRTLLFGVSAHDPVTFIAVPLILAAVALLASYWPARRATRVDPMVSLRYE